MSPGGDLRQRFLEEPRHVLACLRLLVLAGLVALGCSRPPEATFLYWFVTTAYGVTVLGRLAARERAPGLRRARHALLLFDVLVACGLLALRGQEVQGLALAYATVVLLAAVLAGVGNAFVNAAVVAALYLVATSGGRPAGELWTFEHLGPAAFLLVIAVFLGHAAARSAGGRGSAFAHVLGVTAQKLRRSTAQLRQARVALQANERLCTLGMLSAGIAHEIKNPAAALLASVQEAPALLGELRATLAAGVPCDDLLEELAGMLADCQLAGRQLQRVALDLSNLTRGGDSQIALIDPEESLNGAARMLRRKAGADVRLEVDCDAALRIKADPGRLLQVVLNLGGNAIDAMRAAGGGTLVLAARDVGQERVAVEVRDDGPGISEEVQAHMYEPFFTTKGPGQGTGLGLHLVREMVQAQGGTIECESKTEGTTFRVELPAVAYAEEGDGNHGEGEDDPDRGRRGDDSPGAGAHVAA